MSMTKRDFEAVALVLKTSIPKPSVDQQEGLVFETAQRDRIARDLCTYFKVANPAFDRTRFLKAAGVQL